MKEFDDRKLQNKPLLTVPKSLDRKTIEKMRDLKAQGVQTEVNSYNV